MRTWKTTVGDVVAGLGRHGNPCAIGAALLMLAGLVVLSINAGLAQRGPDAWSELADRVRPAPIDAPDPLLDGQPVFIAARAESTQRVHDLDFAISADAVALHRYVEMYQWIEFEHVDPSGRREWRYATDWDGAVHSSARFHEPQGHANPPPALASAWFVSTDARIGPYRISQGPLLEGALQQSRSAQARAAPVTLGDWPRVVTALPEPSFAGKAGFVHYGDRYLSAAAANAPSVGDVRVSFSVLPRDYSMAVIGVQRGGRLEPWPKAQGDAVFLAGGGTLDAATLIDAARQAGATPSQRGWIAGFAGVLLGALGVLPLALDGLRRIPALASASISARVALVFAAALALALLALGVGHFRTSLLPALLLSIGLLALAAFVVRRRRRARRDPVERVPERAAVAAQEAPPHVAAGLELLARRRARLAAIRALTVLGAAAARANDTAKIDPRSRQNQAVGSGLGMAMAAPTADRTPVAVAAPSPLASAVAQSVERRRSGTQATRTRQMRELLDQGIATVVPQSAVVRRCVASRGEWTLNRIARIERSAERIIGFELLRDGVVVKRGSEAEVRGVLRDSLQHAPRSPSRAFAGTARASATTT